MDRAVFYPFYLFYLFFYQFFCLSVIMDMGFCMVTAGAPPTSPFVPPQCPTPCTRRLSRRCTRFAAPCAGQRSARHGLLRQFERELAAPIAEPCGATVEEMHWHCGQRDNEDLAEVRPLPWLREGGLVSGELVPAELKGEPGAHRDPGGHGISVVCPLIVGPMRACRMRTAIRVARAFPLLVSSSLASCALAGLRLHRVQTDRSRNRSVMIR